MIEFFKRLGERLGVNVCWSSENWWVPIDLATAKVNACRALGSDTSGLKPLLVHSMFEVYVRENIERLQSKADFDALVKSFLDTVSVYVDELNREDEYGKDA